MSFLRRFLARQLYRLAGFVEPRSDVYWENFNVRPFHFLTASEASAIIEGLGLDKSISKGNKYELP